jgi:hypothetical protein
MDLIDIIILKNRSSVADLVEHENLLVIIKASCCVQLIGSFLRPISIYSAESWLTPTTPVYHTGAEWVGGEYQESQIP